MKKYGIFIGRFQPFHIGHQAVINEILLDGLTPIIVLGSSNKNRDKDKNPLSFKQRKKLIQLIYPNVEITFIKSSDYDNWTEWYERLKKKILHKTKKNNCTIYYNEKPVDQCNFEFSGIRYFNTWYTDIFKDMGWTTKKIKFADRSDIQIDSNARDIRHDLEGFKHLLDARIYYTLKEWGWK